MAAAQGFNANALAVRRIQSRAWMLVLNNPSVTLHQIQMQLDTSGAIKYTAQMERGREGTRHIQLFLYYDERVSFRTVQRQWRGAHIEKCRSPKLSEMYCRKPETRIEGWYITNIINRNAIGQGARSDLAEVHDAIVLHAMSDSDIATTWFSTYIMHYRGIDRFRSLVETDRTQKTDCFWFYGPSGSGKSKLANELVSLYTDSGAYYKTHGKWWDMYAQQTVVVWDDFRSGSYDIAALLQLLDRYPLIVEIKGGMRKFDSRLVIITCNHTPDEIYGRDADPLMRRITLLLEINHEVVNLDDSIDML